MDLFDGMVLIGSLLITVGVGLLSLPGGLIVGGLLMACAGVLGAAKKGALGGRKNPSPALPVSKGQEVERERGGEER